ncbi:hypothetical protein M8818_004086 [Zalaria obscura]|uniref:Uncharacterized protein n=1 Tax=Zalaria obscura TaxID=2024903 RepID=A0ACC3SEN6_9PEZI
MNSSQAQQTPLRDIICDGDYAAAGNFKRGRYDNGQPREPMCPRGFAATYLWPWGCQISPSMRHCIFAAHGTSLNCSRSTERAPHLHLE